MGDFSPSFHTPTEKDLVDVEVELRAQDPAVLNAAADAVKARIARYPGIAGIADSRKPGKPELRFKLKPEGERLGLRLKDPELERRYPEVEISRGEAAEEADEIMASLKRNTLIALAVIYALLAVSFRSYAQPFLFLLAVPVAWLGGVLAHWALGLNISFQSLVGMVAASGVVVNDSVVLLDYIKQRRETGTHVATLIVDACTSRFRPIFLVSLTNLAGFFPMLFETSEQAKFLVPVTVSLTAGLLFGMVATLVLVPACYAVVEDLRSRVARLKLATAG